MKIKSLAITGVALSALVMSACETSNSTDTSGKDGAKIGEGRTLTVLNYNEFGSDRKFATEQFEKMTGAKVKHVYHAGAEEIRQNLRTGGVGNIDVVEPNTTFLLQLVGQNLIEPIDESKVPNLKKVYPEFLSNPGIRKDGKLYGAPVLWGTTGLVYNTDKIKEKPTSWAALWDPAMKKKVAFRDSAENAIMFAAMYLGQDPYQPELTSVRKALKELRPNIATYWGSSDDFNRAFTTGATQIGNYWDGNTGNLQAEGEPIGYVVPKEGAVGWLDTWSIVKDAPNKDLAYAWIDWMLSTEFQTDWANDPKGAAPGSANIEVSDKLTAEARKRLLTVQINPDEVFMGRPISPKTQQVYQDLWEEVKAGS